MKSEDDATPFGAHAGEPAGIPRKPARGKFEQPVGRLFGRQLVANMKWILLYVAFKGKLDHRDWMSPEVICFEAGGAARIEDFKEFIRFRIDRGGLTGYVIGVDEVNTEGGAGHLRPKVVDVFRISERPGVATGR